MLEDFGDAPPVYDPFPKPLPVLFPLSTNVQLPPATFSVTPLTSLKLVPLASLILPVIPDNTTVPEVPGGVWKLYETCPFTLL